MQLPKMLTLPQMQAQWPALLNPVLANLLIQGQLLTNQNLVTGSNVVNHGLSRQPQGWFLVAPQAAATVYQAASQPNPTLTLTLVATADVSTGIWVF